jgi:hypothetical protein
VDGAGSGLGGEPGVRLVIDVPAKLSARVRVLSTGQGRKTDPVDAHSVAVAGSRSTGLRHVRVDDATVALRLLVDHRDELDHARTQTVNRLHRLLLELLPGGAKKFLSATQARALPAPVRPRDVVGETRRRLAVDLVAELERITATDLELRGLITVTGSTLLGPFGIGPSSAARLLGDIGEIGRFTDKGRFASWNGTAPLVPHPVSTATIACPEPAIAESTGCCTSWLSCGCGTTPRCVPTTDENWLPARQAWKRCGASSVACPTSSIGR